MNTSFVPSVRAVLSGSGSLLGPVVNILAIFSNAYILKKNKRIKIYHIKGIGCSLLISINIDAWGHRWYFPLIIR